VPGTCAPIETIDPGIAYGKPAIEHAGMARGWSSSSGGDAGNISGRERVSRCCPAGADRIWSALRRLKGNRARAGMAGLAVGPSACGEAELIADVPCYELAPSAYDHMRRPANRRS
jgi:hypothetical protein